MSFFFSHVLDHFLVLVLSFVSFAHVFIFLCFAIYLFELENLSFNLFCICKKCWSLFMLILNEEVIDVDGHPYIQLKVKKIQYQMTFCLFFKLLAIFRQS